MLNKKFVINIIGLVLVFEAFFMLISAFVSAIYGESDLIPLLLSTLITFVIGGGAWFFSRNASKDLGKGEGFIVVSFVWVFMSVFGALPFIFNGDIPRFTDAFFEAMSGFTTTGASVLSDIEAVPHGVLFWRSTTHLIGGMGILVLAVAILPYFGFGGMQLYNAEAAGVTNDKLHPRITQTAKSLWGIYMLLILVQTIFLLFGGMSLFDALCHSFGTVASGGFSTKNDSIISYSPYIQYVIIVFMFFAGTNFTLFYFLWKGKFKKIVHNKELQIYSLVLIVSSVVIAVTLSLSASAAEYEKNFRDALFQVTSIVTSTGFVTADYTIWHPALTYIIFLLMFAGASTGSTSGGIKIMRHHILIKNTMLEFKRMIHPSAVVPLKIRDKVIQKEIVYKVLAFVMMYFVIFVMGSLVLTFFGMDMDSSMGAAATTMGGIGPGLGTVGPMNNFAAVPEGAKWVLSFLMLLGRLELFSVLILFSPEFWKNS